ncbi:MAG: DNA polymerase III subunit gamma/tau [Clostridia bacterium]|nr:DNA polymerase III subunit gamma/tau [Clostridia bacterium]
MAYNALYRKYRPKRFSEVIGQEHITSVLLNQVITGRTAHAYLFSGSRGTGKTSTARILARALNCLDPQNGEPCGECTACRLNFAESIDIIEMDAASNSGVDDMRALIDKAEFAPIYLRSKIYIIDEAHMLSKSAENALLKTLEEPPAHVVFILATTEPQALAPTILSRCQRFEFRRLSVDNLVMTTKRILNDAGAEIDDEGMIMIARAAEGGMRDCLSIADQCFSLCGNSITADDVLLVLGSMNSDFIFAFADALISNDQAAVMKNIADVVASGRDLGVFIRDIAAHFRSLLFVKTLGDCSDILDCTKDMTQRYIAQAEKTGKARLERTLTELMNVQQELKFALMPRLLLESALLRLCHPEDERDLAAIMDRVDELEKKLKQGAFIARTENPQTDKSGEEDPADKSNTEEKPKQEKAKLIVDDVFVAPKATPQSEDLFKRFMMYLMPNEIMLGSHLQLAAAHWCDDENLYFCFDKTRRSNYNYATTPDSRARLERAAETTIRPFGVEIILKDGSVRTADDTPKELYGVKITEE